MTPTIAGRGRPTTTLNFIVMAKNKKLPARETLASQYSDMRDDSSTECLAPVTQMELSSAPLDPDSRPDPVDSTHPAPASVPDLPEDEAMIEGSWFCANAVSSHSKRFRDTEETDIDLGSLPEPSKKSKAHDQLAVAGAPPSHSSNYPTNKTLASSDSHTVIISQLMLDKDGFLGAATRAMSLDPLGISKGLKAVLDFDTVKDVRINRRRNVVAVEFKQLSAVVSPDLLLLSHVHLGKYAVRCYRPASVLANIVYGVVGPVDLEEDHDLAEVELALKRGDTTIVSVVRLSKFTAGRREPSSSLKVGFDAPTLPKFVPLDFVRVPVRPFRESPLRCYRCQRHGHIASGCDATLRCLVCGGGHRKDDCSASVPLCANCGGAHIASSRECPFTQDASQINDLRRQGMSFSEARKHVIGFRENRPPTMAGVPREQPREKSSPAVHPQALLSQHSASASQWASSQDAFRSAGLPVSQQGGLQAIEVPIEVHSSQGSYIIPRRFPHPSHRPALSYLETARCGLSKRTEEIPEALASPSSAVVQSLEESLVARCSTIVESSLEERLVEKCTTLIESSLESFFSKLSAFFIELFSMNILNENKNQRKLLLIGLIRNHFGSNISQPILDNFQRSMETSSASSKGHSSQSAESTFSSQRRPSGKSSSSSQPAASSLGQSRPATRATTVKKQK